MVGGESVFMTINAVFCLSVLLFWGIIICDCIRYVTVIRLLLVTYRFVKVSSGTEKATT